MGELKFYCECCGCRIQIEDDLDERICEECRNCPHGEGPCQAIEFKPRTNFNIGMGDLE